MKSIKILTLLFLLVGFISVNAQQSMTEVQNNLAEPAMAQSGSDQLAADQPPVGQIQENLASSSSVMQAEETQVENSGLCADDEAFNSQVPPEEPVESSEIQSETNEAESSSLAADQDPNEISPDDK